MQDRSKGSHPAAENSNNPTPVFLTREALATRWSVSVRTIDRRRLDGSLSWTDLNAGRGHKPIVRFLLKDIEDYEEKARLNIL
jgi:hypothetical protein